MPKKTAPPVPPDPNRLVRQAAGTYHSEDGRFEVREGGIGWFLTDGEQANELGQALVLGPYPTLVAVRDALPEARRTTIRPLPQPRRRRSADPAGADKPKQPTKAAKRKVRPPEHRLVKILREAARDRFPRVDLDVEVVGSPPGPVDAVVAFTGHSLVAAGVDSDEVRAHLPGDDPGGPMSAPFLTWLGLQLGVPPESLDLVLVADGTGAVDPDRPLEPVDLDEDAVAFATGRIERARAHRSAVRAFVDAERTGVVIVGRGLAERREVSVEVAPHRRGRGIGTALARAARGLVPGGEPLFAQVAPGNVASVRAFLRAGYRPIGSEVLFVRPTP